MDDKKRKERKTGMYMSDFEICKAYREAKHKREQIGILAELNATTTKKITEILVANGEKSFAYPASKETMERLEKERLERLETMGDVRQEKEEDLIRPAGTFSDATETATTHPPEAGAHLQAGAHLKEAEKAEPLSPLRGTSHTGGSEEGGNTEKLLVREFERENPGCGEKKNVHLSPLRGTSPTGGSEREKAETKKPSVPGTVMKLIDAWLEENKAEYDEAKKVVKAYEEAEDWFFGRGT